MTKNKSSELSFKVYYSNGETFSGTKKNVGDTPIWEVLAIVENDEQHGRKVVSGGDFYIYQDEKWISCDYWTMMQYMARKGMRKRFLVGVMVSEDVWVEIMSRARTDPDFPSQTAFHRYENQHDIEKAG